MTDQPVNGYVRWRDLDERDRRISLNHDADIVRIQDEFIRGMDRAHTFHTELAGSQSQLLSKLENRVDAVESVIDQQRGARNLVYGLIGTNILLAISAFVMMFSVIR